VRKLTAIGLVAAALLLGLAAAGRGTGGARRATGRAGLTIRLAPGWRLVQRRLTPLIDPAPRLALATFHVKPTRHLCVCETPNVRVPRGGAFVIVWEWLRPTPSALRRLYPPRPARFTVTQNNPHWFECAGPSWGTLFRAAGRAFQVDVYLGPAADPSTRARIAAMLESLAPSRARPSRSTPRLG
jgi:hypothetical protein